MKKTLCLLLSILMMVSIGLTPVAGQEETEAKILIENDYSSTTGILSTSYSDAPSDTTTFKDENGEDVPYSEMVQGFPKFELQEGKLVYDSTGMSKEAEYPYMQSDRPVYARANFNGTGYLPYMASVNTYEFELQLDGEMPERFEFMLRYGNTNWINGTTQDEALIRIGNGSINGFNSGGYKIETGKNYKFGIMVDNTQETPTKTLYINNELVGTANATVSASTDPEIRTKLCGIAYVVRSYSGSNTNYQWTNTKVTIDNFKIIEGDHTSDYVKLNLDTTLFKSPDGNPVYTWVQAERAEGDEFRYTMETSLPGVSVEEDTGKLTITNEAEVGSVHKVRAELISDPSQYIIRAFTIAETFGHDFENGEIKPSGGSWTQGTCSVETDEDGNHYAHLESGSRLNAVPPQKIESGISAFTIEFDFLAQAGRNPLAINGSQVYENDKLNTSFWWMSIMSSAADNLIRIRDMRGNTIAEVDAGSWVKFKIKFDAHENKYSFILNDTIATPVFDFSRSYTAGSTAVRVEKVIVNSLIFQTDVDNIKVYSGIEAMEGIEIENSTILIPPEGKMATNQIRAGGSDTVYSLKEPYEGVSIDPSTGVVYVSSQASEGTVYVNVTSGGAVSSGAFTLTKRTMEPDGGSWTNGTSADGFRVLPAADYLRYDVSTANAGGRMVLQATVRVPEDQSGSTRYTKTIGVSTKNYKDWPVIISLPTDPGEYQVRLILDLTEKTYTAFVDGEMIVGPEQRFTDVPNSGGASIFEDTMLQLQAFIFGVDVKEGQLYHVSCEALPEAHNISAEIKIGSPVQPSYTYFNESGLPEECSKISYIISDTPEGEGESVSEYTPTVADIGKYVTIVVNPGCSGGVIMGGEYKSQPMEIKYTGSYKILSIQVTSSAGQGDSLVGGGTVTGAEIKKEFDYKEGTMYITLYENGKLLDVGMASIPAMSAGETQRISLTKGLTLPETVSDCTVKAMIFDETLMPMASVFSCRGYRGDQPAQLFLISDSLCQEYGQSSWPMQGWGKYIGSYFSENLTVQNKAKSGYSTKLYLDPQTEDAYNWNKIKESIQPGDYVLVALGINDNSTQSWGTTETEYRENLTTFIQDTRAAGGEILFQTPTVSGNAEGSGSWSYNTASGWARRGALMAEVAEEYGVVCLPLGAAMVQTFNDQAAQYIEAGDEATDAYDKVRYDYYIYHSRLEEDWGFTSEEADAYKDGADDTTHLNDNGAQAIAQLIAQLIGESNSSLVDYLK